MTFCRGLNQPSFGNAEEDRVGVVSLGFRVQLRQLFCVSVAKQHRRWRQSQLSELISHMRLHILFRFDRDSLCF